MSQSSSRWGSEPPRKVTRWFARHRTLTRVLILAYAAGNLLLIGLAVREGSNVQIVTGSINVFVAGTFWVQTVVILPRYVHDWDSAHPRAEQGRL